MLVVTCGQKEERTGNDTILKGELTLLVDETVLPIVQDEVDVFESRYDAKITLEPKSEAELIQILAKDSARVAVLARNLTAEEKAVFASRKINPRVTKFAVDGVALIVNDHVADTLVTVDDLLNVLRGKPSKLKGLVFDNPNSSTARYLDSLAGVAEFSKQNVYSFKTNEETVRYVAQNDGMVGVVGLNWVYNPPAAIQPEMRKIRLLSVKTVGGNSFVSPSQNDIAEGRYPLARDLFVVNCQGYSGLGMGFASFVAGETGQRIILKSGLVPARMPSRKLHIRSQIEQPKK